MIVADTSFLLSLYGNDPNTLAATSKFRLLAGPIQLHVFNDFAPAEGLIVGPDLEVEIKALADQETVPLAEPLPDRPKP